MKALLNPIVPEGLKKSRLKVLIWTRHYFLQLYNGALRVPNPNGPDIEMEFTRDRNTLAEADAVWFHAPSIRDMPPMSEKTQPWVLMSMESDVNYPVLSSPVAEIVFDLTMTYRLDSDIPCIYPNRHQYGDFLTPAPENSSPDDASVVYIASHAVKERDDYVQALMEHIPVDCLGDCLNNRSIKGFVRGSGRPGARHSLLDHLPGYRFCLAFENSRSTDYVTERAYHALMTGLIPIYRGAPNVLDFMPADDAVIQVDDFSGPAELAQYLNQLNADPDALAGHLEWKSSGPSPRFEKLLDLGSTDPRARLAVKLAHGCDRSCNCGGRLREPGQLA